MQNLNPIRASMIFSIATGYFILLLFTLFPFLKSQFSVNPALYWFITGYFLFIPIFAYAVIMAKEEGNHTFNDISLALNIKSMTQRDWGYAFTGSLLVFIFTGIIFGISSIAHNTFGLRPIRTFPWFIEMSPFQGIEKLFLTYTIKQETRLSEYLFMRYTTDRFLS
jgi:hypothetical protein